MKLVIRTAVAALALTGAFASTQVSSASANTKIVVARNSALPTPMCPPDSPDACGLYKK